MDAEYLKQNVGDILSDGLTACVLRNPADPVEFVGNYLINTASKSPKQKKSINESNAPKKPSTLN